MEGRFRIRTADGQELEPRTLEIFSEMVRSGVIRPEDLVFDALTGKWVPAREHPMVRLLGDPLVASAPAQGHVLDLALVDPSSPSAEEQEAAFIRRMDKERRADPERAPLSLEMPVTAGRGVSPAASPPPEEAPAATAAPADAAPAEAAPAKAAPAEAAPAAPRPAAVRPDAPAAEALPGIIARAPARRAPPRRWPWWTALGVAAVAVVILVARAVLTSGSPSEAGPGVAEAPVRRAARAQLNVQDGARAAFLARVSELQAEAGLGQVPEVWLEGRYLAGAAAYPQVRGYWEGIGAFVDRVQREEESLYREAWLVAAEDAGISGPVRSLRLATALEDFAGAAPEREEHYRRVREISAAAVGLHDVLLQLGGRVTYEPLRGQALSADPVLEAAGTDPAAQALLEQALDRVLEALRGPQGDSLRDRARLAAWMAEIPVR